MITIKPRGHPYSPFPLFPNNAPTSAPTVSEFHSALYSIGLFFLSMLTIGLFNLIIVEGVIGKGISRGAGLRAYRVLIYLFLGIWIFGLIFVADFSGDLLPCAILSILNVVLTVYHGFPDLEFWPTTVFQRFLSTRKKFLVSFVTVGVSFFLIRTLSGPSEVLIVAKLNTSYGDFFIPAFNRTFNGSLSLRYAHITFLLDPSLASQISVFLTFLVIILVFLIWRDPYDSETEKKGNKAMDLFKWREMGISLVTLSLGSYFFFLAFLRNGWLIISEVFDGGNIGMSSIHYGGLIRSFLSLSFYLLGSCLLGSGLVRFLYATLIGFPIRQVPLFLDQKQKRDIVVILFFSEYVFFFMPNVFWFFAWFMTILYTLGRLMGVVQLLPLRRKGY